MKRFLYLPIVFVLFLIPGFPGLSAPNLPTPESHFGYTPGADRKLMTYEEQINYLQKLSANSDRILLKKEGESPMGKPMYLCFISSPENIRNLNALKEINRKLALEPSLSDTERKKAIENGRVFLLETLSMHSNEVGPSQAFPLFAYQMATTTDPGTLKALKNVVLMVVPCHNPDGMDMVVNWYRKTLGTKYEGSSLPGVYHKYVGHDNNRDFVTLTQKDTRVIARIYSTEWYPQVMVEKHQMGSSGPRFFVPENHDPIAENIDAGLWNWMKVFGADLSRDMTADGLKGVVSHWEFDNYWPGSTETALWKNVISFLTENASCRKATPVFVEPTELRAWGKGLSEYKKSVNMPEPWPGGWWHLRNIVNYELSSMRSILNTAAANRTAILKFRNNMCRREVKKGMTEPPYAYVLPAIQYDPGALADLVDLLHLHGIRIYRLTEDKLDGTRQYRKGDVVVPLAQPYRSFIKEVMEKQVYPVRHYTPGGKVIQPYDITSWSLPLHRGLTSFTVTSSPDILKGSMAELKDALVQNTSPALPAKFFALGLSANFNDSYEAAFAALDAGIPVLRLTASAIQNNTTLPAGSFLLVNDAKSSKKLAELVQSLKISPAILKTRPDVLTTTITKRRIGLIETWRHDMDAGWTRFIFDQYHIPYTVLHPADLEKVDLKSFDVLVFPDANKDVLLSGSYKGKSGYMPINLPKKYRKGMGEKGKMNVISFLNSGGIILSWRSSTGLFTGNLKLPLELRGHKRKKTKKKEKPKSESFRLPVRDLSKSARSQGLYVPGSLLKMELIHPHPLTWGMPAETAVFSRGTPVFRTTIPIQDMDRRVVGFYPRSHLLVSGYLEGESALAFHPAMIWLKKGKGQLVLYGFNPQFRASTPGTYKLLFNGLLLPGLP
ncbi:MAG: hypothetical protein GXO70_10465 [Acidobacteria bacterium]|nr:hypothetical protein [Acidobacteriota bacterium]